MIAILFLIGLHFSPLRAPPPTAAGQEPPPAAEAWPKLASDMEKKAAMNVERLRKARTEEMGESAHDVLLELGPGAAPLLLQALAREQDEAARKRIATTLTALTGAEYALLLSKEFENKAVPVRIWALTRTARYGDRALGPAAEGALERARKGKDGAELYAAALCATASGSLAGLDVLFATAQEGWKEHGAEMRTALARWRSPEATQFCASKLKDEDRPAPRPQAEPLNAADRVRIVAVLNLLSACGDESAKPIVKPFLDSGDNSVRVAAVNAARGILDNEPPVVELSAFEAVEMAKKLKDRM